MESSRAKIAGPVIAAGAVSVGLVLIGACGLGKHDTYVAPPPIRSVGDAAPVVRDGTTATAPRVIIPPSPSWKVAPAGPPRRPVGFTDPSTSFESTTRPTRTPTLSATTSPAAVPPPIISTNEIDPPTTQPQPTIEDPPTTTRRPPTTTSEGVHGEEDE